MRFGDIFGDFCPLCSGHWAVCILGTLGDQDSATFSTRKWWWLVASSNKIEIYHRRGDAIRLCCSTCQQLVTQPLVSSGILRYLSHFWVVIREFGYNFCFGVTMFFWKIVNFLTWATSSLNHIFFEIWKTLLSSMSF